MNKISIGLFIVAIFLSASSCGVKTVPGIKEKAAVSIIPKPETLDMRAGTFAITHDTKIVLRTQDSQAADVARYFIERMNQASGIELQILPSTPRPDRNAIILEESGEAGYSAEGYELEISPLLVTIKAAGPRGFFYGIQTLFQLLPPAVYSEKKSPVAARSVWSLPCLKITDSPRYAWRGMLLDVSRHFFSKEFIKEYIDFLAMHKMNTFHWHLTDDQGWRIEIKHYPKLTEIGAWRVDREDKHWNARERQQPGEKATYGGFYTQEDIKEIIDYAKSRFVTIVPEIEMPGHCLSALASYPQYSCSGGPFTVPPGGYWPIRDVYCPGNEETFEFLENILSEVIELFPGEFIHIGGDEVDKTSWKECAKCQARMKAEGLKTEEELQSYFVKRIENFINSKGKKLIGWDEILEGGLAPNAGVMSWRGTEGGIAAARERHDVVMTPTSHCYFDYYQGDPGKEPTAIGGFLPLRTVYSFEPTPQELSLDEGKHIIGAQANLWTEYIANPPHAEYMTFPRIAAIAEAGWSQKASRSWDDFISRMTTQFARYESAGINYAKSAYDVRVLAESTPARREIGVKLDTETSRPEIRFTMNGKNPGPASKLYRQPLIIRKTATLKAGTFLDGKLAGKITEARFDIHKASGKAVQYEFPFAEKFTGGGAFGLVDGLRGSISPNDGRWQGFEGDDLVAVIDLGKPQKISRITAGFLQRSGSWIFLPKSIEFAVSRDGKEFQVLSNLSHEVSPLSPDAIKKDFTARAENIKARYIRVHAKNIGVCPVGHLSVGNKAWLFADEIIVE